MLLQRAVRVGVTNLISGRRGRMSLLAKRLAFGAAAMAVCAPAWAGPEGERVVAGQAGFRRFGPQTTITASHGAIINYHSFNIGPMESVRFIQPSSDSRVLNRIDGPDPSVIAGRLVANGIVYIMNPSGVYFRQGALVNVGQIYAGAARLTDADFLAGRNHFTDVSGNVVNEGVINTQTGATLVGQVVANEGVINASAGVVAMASGDDVLVGEAGGNVYVRVTNRAEPGTGNANPSNGSTGGGRTLGGSRGQGSAASARVSNTGTINNDNGRTTMVAGDVYGMAIFGGGRIKSREVNIEGQGRGVVQVAGHIDASNTNAGQTGGRVTVTGEHVRVTGGTIDASGAARGGQVNVGGEWQGGGETRRASTTLVDGGSTLRADAVDAGGTGGTVVAWSDGTTGFYGTASAQGGTGGAGGMIETSGKQTLDVRGATIRAGSENGQAGTWLLDPSDVNIRDAASSGGSVDPVTGAYTISADSAVINAADITDALEAGANVTIHTNNAGGTQQGNIVVGDGVAAATINPTLGAGTNVTLSLRAANNITINNNASITPAGAGTLGLVLSARDAAGGTIGATGLVTISTALNIGSLTVTGRTIALDGGTITTSGNQSYSYDIVTATQGLSLNAATTMTSTAGNITLGTSGHIGTVRGANSLSLSAPAGTVTFNTTVGNGASQPTSLTVGANAISIVGGFIRTSTTQAYTGPVSVNTVGNSFNFTGTNLTFNGTLRSAVQGEEAMLFTSTGVTTFNAAVGGASGDFASLVASGTGGSIVFNGGGASTTGNQVYINGVTLSVDSTFTASNVGANVQFISTLEGTTAGQESLTVTGAAVFGGTVGDTTALESLSVTGTSSIAASIETATTQTYGGAVTLAGTDGTNRALQGTTITFNGAVDATTSGAQGLDVTGNAVFNQAVGAGTALAEISVSGTTAINTTSIRTATTLGSGDQTYTGAVTLGTGAATTVGITTGSGTATFGTLDATTAGEQGLAVTGNAAFGGVVGGNAALGGLSVSGTTALNAATVTTTNAGGLTGNQSFVGDVTLGGGNDTTTTLASTGGTITFGGAVEGTTAGEQSLATTGSTVFSGANGVGGATALGAISVTGNVSLTGASYITTNTGGASGNQTYSGTTTLAGANGSTTTLNSTGGTVGIGTGLAATTAGQQGLAIVGSAVFNSTTTGTALSAISVSGTTALNEATLTATNSAGGTGNIALTGAVTLGGGNDTNSTLTSTGGTVSFGAAVNATTAGEQGLDVTGNATFAGDVGAGTALRQINVSGTTALTGTADEITTTNAGGGTGSQNYTGAVTLNNGNGTTTTLTSTGSSVTLSGGVDGTTAGEQALSIAGNATLGTAAIGGSQALRSLAISGTTQLGATAVNTTDSAGGSGDQTYTGAVTLTGTTGTTSTLTATGGTVAFGAALDASGAGTQGLAITGAATFTGDVGGSAALGGLSVSGTASLPAAITTSNAGGLSGNQTFTGAATLNADTTLASTGGLVRFQNTLNGSGAGTEDLAVTGNARFDDAVGGTNALGQLTVSGTTTIAGASIATSNAGGSSGNQTYTGAVTLANADDSNVTLTSTGGTVGFGSTVDGTTAGEQGLAVSGNASMGGSVGGTTALRGVSVSGTTSLSGNVTTTNTGGGTGDQSYTGAVTLAGAGDPTYTLTSTGGTITFTGAVDATTAGEQSLATVGNVSFGSAVGGTAALGSLNASGGTIALPAAVTTSNAGGASGNQTYGSAITLGADTTLTATGGTVSFTSTVDGTTAGQEDLTITGNGSFGTAVGGTTALGALSVSGTTNLAGGAVTTQGTQTYTGAVTLAADTTLDAGAGDIMFGSTVDSADATARDLTLNSTGTTTFGGNVGTTFALDTLSTNAGGQTTINAPTITTSGDQTFGDNVVLAVDTTLSAANASFNGDLNGTVANQQGLTINTPSSLGAVSFGGSTGGTTPLEFLNLNGVLTLTADTTFVIDSITLANIRSTGGAWDLTLTCAIDATIGNTSNLDNSAAVDVLLSNGAGTTTLLAGSIIRTTGAQTFSSTGGTILGGTAGQNVTLLSGGAVNFGAIDSAAGGARGLIVTTSADTTFSGAIGATQALSRLQTDGGGTTNLGAGTISTNGSTVVFDDAVVLTADTTITDTGSGVFFNSTVDSDGTARDLTVTATTGAVTFGQSVGATAALDTLSVTATTAATFGSGNAGTFSVNAGGDILVTGPAILLSDMTFASTAGGVTFDGTIDSFDATAHSLTVNSTALTAFNADIGATNTLSELNTNAGGTTRLGNFAGGGSATINITTGGMSNGFGDAVLLGANVIFDAGAGAVTFGSTLDSVGATAFALAVNSSGATTFSGDVGATNVLDTLSTSGGSTIFGTGVAGVLVSTANAQSYTSAVTINVGTGNAATFTAAAGGVTFGQTLDGNAAGTDAVVVTNAGTFAGDVGTTNALASLSVGGAASIGGNVSTTNAGGGSGDQTFSGAVTLAGANDTTQAFTSTGGLVSFGTTIDATTAGEQGLSVVGNASFNGIIGGTAALRDLAVSGTSAINTTAITTTESGGGTGNQTFTGAVTFGTGNDSTITFTSGTGTVGFGAAVDGATAGEQSIVISGNASFTGNVGATTALGALNVTGTTNFMGASITTDSVGGATGTQTYGGTVTLNSGDDSTATFTATGGSVNFNGGLSGTAAGEQSVVVNGDASITGSTTVALGGLTVTGNTTLGNGNIDTTNAGGGTGAQNYGSVTLSGAPGSTTTLNADGGNITLGNVEAQADNGQNFVVNATNGGQTLFNGTVGATNALASLLVTGGASINTTSFRTTNAGGGTGNQTFNGAITFGTGNDSTITFDATGGTVTFAGALEGQAAGEQAIVITGNASFGGAIGATTALASISVGGTTTINGSSVVTTNAGGGSGNQTYTGAVTFTSGMGSTFTFNTTGGSVNFGSTLDGSGAGFESVIVTGNTTFGGIVGGINALAALSVSGTANINTTAINTTNSGGGTGNQTFSGAVVLGAPDDSTTTFTATGGTVAFNDTLNGSTAGEQSITIAGNGTFGGNVGGTTALGALAVSGTTNIGAVTIATSNAGGASGNQLFSGAVTLNGANDTTATLTSTGGLITFANTLDATAAGEQGLAINGNASFQNVGATTALRSLAVSGTSALGGLTYRTTNAGGGSGNQNYTGATTLASANGASVTFTATGGTATFGATLDASAPGAQTVTINGNAAFVGAVGGTNRLFRMNVAGTAAVGHDVFTTLGQLYSGDVTLTRAGGDNNGLSTFDGGDGPMTFLGNVNATASGQQGIAVRTTGTMRFEAGAASANLFPNGDGQIGLLRSYQPPIGFGGSIGGTTPLRSIELTTTRALSPAVSTIIFAPGLTSENRVPDSIPSGTIDATTFSLRATDTITFGYLDKVLAFGSLTLTGAGGNSLNSARIGDITALRTINITADQIAIRRRAGGFILGQTDGSPSNTVINNDRGIDLLGTAITFSVEPFVHDGTIDNPTQISSSTVQADRIVAFATPDGSGVTIPNYTTVQAFGDIAAQFTDRGPAPSPGFFLPLDLRSEGPVNTSISNTLAAFVVVEPPDIEQSTSLGSALRDELREIAILTRDLDPSEFVEFLVGRALFDDRFESVPATSSLSTGGTGRAGVGVAVARLAADVVRKVLTNFKELKAEQDAYRDGIAAAYEAFLQTEAGQTEEFDPKAFHAFVMSDAGSTVARTAFDKLAVIFRDIDQLGLGPVETAVCKRKIVGFVRPSEMTDDELVKAIETQRLTASAAR